MVRITVSNELSSPISHIHIFNLIDVCTSPLGNYVDARCDKKNQHSLPHTNFIFIHFVSRLFDLFLSERKLKISINVDNGTDKFADTENQSCVCRGR